MAVKRRKKAESRSRGLEAREAAEGTPPAAATALRDAVREDGGAALALYRDPLGGHWQLLASLPIDKVEPTAFQRDLSETHVKRLTGVIDALGRFLDPIIAVRGDDGVYRTPNGHHRLASLRNLGARSVTALVLPEPEIAYKILALNTEKAHNLREKSLEVIRMARDLAQPRRPRREGLRARVRGGRVPDARRLLREERPLRRRRVPSRAETRRDVSGESPSGRPSRSARSAPGASSSSRRPSPRRCRRSRTRASTAPT